MDNKPRRPWIAVLMTLLSRGLGHLYLGNPQRGLILFGIQECLFILFAVSALIIVPNLVFLVFVLVCSIAYVGFCVADAVSIAKIKREHYELTKYNRWYFYVGYFIIFSIFVSALVSAGVKAYLIQAYKIPGGSMIPTLLIGDHLLANKFIYKTTEPKRGDIIIFPLPEDPSREWIKRVVAVEGDTIQMINQKVYINGKYIDEPYTQHTDTLVRAGQLEPRDNFGPYLVHKGKLFVMGDNREQSFDSRFWGYVSRDTVKGKAMSLYWSWNSISTHVRWDRIGKPVQ